MTVKKTWAAILAFTMICGAATGCTNSNGSSTSDSETQLQTQAQAPQIPSHWFGIPTNLRKITRLQEMRLASLSKRLPERKWNRNLQLTTPSQSSLFPTAQHRSDAAWVQKDTARRKPQTMP